MEINSHFDSVNYIKNYIEDILKYNIIITFVQRDWKTNQMIITISFNKQHRNYNSPMIPLTLFIDNFKDIENINKNINNNLKKCLIEISRPEDFKDYLNNITNKSLNAILNYLNNYNDNE